MIENITPLIITYNEAPNIQRTLDRLLWARRIVVVDSGSTDSTLEVLRKYPQVVVLHRSFDNFANQCNFGLGQIDTTWVLSLDADYELSAELVEELKKLKASETIGGFRAGFIYRVFGRPLRASLYPPRIVLYRRDRAKYVNKGHGHQVLVSGNVKPLDGLIYHDDRKSLTRWLTSQRGYAVHEAEYLLSCGGTELNKFDRVRRAAWIAPIAVLFHTLIIKRCLFDGWPGWYYALQRLVAESIIALEIIERRIGRDA